MRNNALWLLALAACVGSNPPPGPFGPPPGPPGPPPGSEPPTGAPNGGGIAVGGEGAYSASLANQQQSAVVLACDQRANEVKGSEHTAWYMQCPPCAATHAGLWGTDVYTDDSGVCAAAIHVGALSANGGIVLVTWIPGQLTYVGTEHNGFKSSDYNKWGRSFYVQAVDATGRPTTPPPKPLPPDTVRMSCDHPGNAIPANTSMHVICPAGCASGRLWGTDIYTGDSSACLAAAHAGLITTAEGGTFTLAVGGAQPKFTGSKRHGVSSSEYGSFGSSFRVSP